MLSEQAFVRLTRRLTSSFGKVLPAIDDEYAAMYYTHLHIMVVLSAEIESRRKKQPRQECGRPGEPLRSEH
ncbi:hypothetical protein [Streptomyces sp. NPDC001770]